jgi:5,10-methenyltetrahydromethanopterin hydrogenase
MVVKMENYIVSYNDALNQFIAIKKETIEKLSDLGEIILSLFPNSDVDSEIYNKLIDKIKNTIDKLKE